MLQEHIWMHNAPGAYLKKKNQNNKKLMFVKMHNAPGAYSRFAPGAVYIQIMLLEHIELRIRPQIIHAPRA